MDIVLAFWVCQAAAGTAVCERVQLDAPSIEACQMQGQFAIAKWLGEHPAWTFDGLKGYVCGPRGRDA